MNLTPDEKFLIRHAIESGRLHREEDAVREALSLWAERERRRIEILATVDKAEASLARDEGRKITSAVGAAALADDVKRRGMARLSAGRNTYRWLSFAFRPRRKRSLMISGFTLPGERSSIDVANRVIDKITGRFWLLARYPHLGRP